MILTVRRLLFVFLLLGLLGGSFAQEQPADAPDSATAYIREVAERLTGPDFLGRDALTADAAVAAGYITGELYGLGLEPAGADGSFLQRFTLVQERPAVSTTRLLAGGQLGRYGTDFVLVRADREFMATATVVGVSAEDGYDPAGFIAANADVIRDAVLIVEAGEEDGPGPDVSAFSAAGALMVLQIGDPETAGEAVWRERLATPSFQDEVAIRQQRVPSGVISPELAEAALSAGSVTVRIGLEARTVPAMNILARLPGRDPEAPALMLGAHYDHLGVIDGEVYPGADDNASGVAVLLQVIRQLTAGDPQPPADVYFAFWTLEERGLLGSTYYVSDPTVPFSRLRGYVNMDMVGRNSVAPDHDDLLVLGYDLAPGAEGLREALGSAGGPDGLESFGHIPLKLQLDEMLPAAGLEPLSGVLELAGQTFDLRPTYYFGTDTLPFAWAGVPAVGLTSIGMLMDYHVPTDTADKLAYGKMLKVAQLLVDLVLSGD